MRIAAALMAVGLALAACSPTTEVPSTEAGSAAVTACIKSGGTMQPVGRAQTLQCIMNYADAGKICTDASQCQGDCLVGEDAASAPSTGRCAPTNNRFGCRTTIENGVAKPTLCID